MKAYATRMRQHEERELENLFQSLTDILDNFSESNKEYYGAKGLDCHDRWKK